MSGSGQPSAGGRLRPNLYSIPAGQPFLDVLADAVLNDRLDLGIGLANPADLARLTIYLPTRRAVRAFASVLLRNSGQKALILPRLVPLGDPGEADMADALDITHDEARLPDETLPINPIARQLLLAIQIRHASRALDRVQMAEKASGVREGGSLNASTLGSAFALGGDLAAILDAMQSEDVPYERMLTLDATRFDEIWQMTARFLAILGETWPAVLAERGECDPVIWRNRQLARQSARLGGAADAHPVIVAGSTGSMPATARLIATVARLSRGAVVLPDLDLETDAAAWADIADFASTSPDRGASHPQAQLARLMSTMQAERGQVRTLLHHEAAPARRFRRTLAHEALRPADSTSAWRTLPERLGEQQLVLAFQDVDVVEVPDERTEALAIALLIRQQLSNPACQIALVTPDRGLAERVAIELQRWDIHVDDSAGRPLGRTAAGHALLLLLNVLHSGGAGRDIVELAQHPQLHLGLLPAVRAAARQAIEIGVLRGSPAPVGLAGLKRALADMPDRIAEFRAPRPRKRLTDADVAAAGDLVSRLEHALSPLLADVAHEEFDLGGCIARMRQALIVLGTDADGEVALLSGDDGVALAAMFDDLEAGLVDATGSIDDLATICRTVMGGRVVRLKGRQHPRLALLGPLEARLMSPGLVILGGLNEGSWPPQIKTDPFLNRAMRAELGLSSPERRIGQSAHDFIQAFAAERVVITRPVKAAGVQALPSRFWQRLKAVTPPHVWAAARQRGDVFAALAGRLDQPETVAPCRRPTPMPPLHLQPVRFSMTDAEILYRDPYAIFAREVLKLSPLEPPEMVLGAADRGQLMHAVLERFAHAWPAALPPDPLTAILDEGRAVFAPLMHEPDVAAFWWPRFVMLAPEIAAWELARRPALGRVGAEMRIRHKLRLGDGSEVTLSARADRIELRADGSLVILDFKTGSIPTPKQIKAGLAPQLLLEAALAPMAPFVPVDAASGQPELGPGDVASALYLALKPGSDAMDEKPVAPEAELQRLAREHLAGFIRMVDGFRNGERSFTSRFAAQFMRFDGDYDHLARVKEWSAAGHDSDEDAA